MRKRLIPTALSKTIFEIPADFYIRRGIKLILTDLDNTLDPYFIKTPSPNVFEWKERILSSGLKIAIASNNTGKRVSTYASALGVPFVGMLGKPFSRKLRLFLKEKGFKASEVILIGDQIVTDVKCARGAGVPVILTERISPKEPLWTRFNRLFDTPKRKKVKKYALAPEWRELP